MCSRPTDGRYHRHNTHSFIRSIRVALQDSSTYIGQSKRFYVFMWSAKVSRPHIVLFSTVPQVISQCRPTGRKNCVLPTVESLRTQAPTCPAPLIDVPRCTTANVRLRSECFSTLLIKSGTPPSIPRHLRLLFSCYAPSYRMEWCYILQEKWNEHPIWSLFIQFRSGSWLVVWLYLGTV